MMSWGSSEEEEGGGDGDATTFTIKDDGESSGDRLGALARSRHIIKTHIRIVASVNFIVWKRLSFQNR
jgi:hypothetical protein